MIELTLYIGFAFGLVLGLFIGAIALITQWNRITTPAGVVRAKLLRWQQRWWIIRNSADALNRRVAVENHLLDCATGKRPPPSRDECKRLAYKLGMPARAGNRRIKGMDNG